MKIDLIFWKILVVERQDSLILYVGRHGLHVYKNLVCGTFVYDNSAKIGRLGAPRGRQTHESCGLSKDGQWILLLQRASPRSMVIILHGSEKGHGSWEGNGMVAVPV